LRLPPFAVAACCCRWWGYSCGPLECIVSDKSPLRSMTSSQNVKSPVYVNDTSTLEW
jgi:hypothetical protein